MDLFRVILISLVLVDAAILNFAAYKTIFYRQITTPVVSEERCPDACINRFEKTITAIPSPTPIKETNTNERSEIEMVRKVKNVSYIQIPGNGEVLNTNWTDIPGTEFYLDTGDYPNLIEGYFEANMKLFNGNGMAYVRLFDATVGIEVWGSEVKTNRQNNDVVSSGKITLRPGKHFYKVQARSLTADSAIFNSGRIKIISEN